MELADDKHAEMHLAQNVCPHSLKDAGSSKTSKQMEQMMLSSGVLRKISVGCPMIYSTPTPTRNFMILRRLLFELASPFSFLSSPPRGGDDIEANAEIETMNIAALLTLSLV